MNNGLAATISATPATPATGHSGGSVKPAGGLETTSIEALLIWAYQAQRVAHTEYWGGFTERRWLCGPGISADGVAAVARAMMLEAIIPGTAIPGMEVDPHPDALAVHGAVLTLDAPGRQRQGLAATVMRHAIVGTRPAGWDGPVIKWRQLTSQVAGLDGLFKPVYLDRRGDRVRESWAWFCPMRLIDNGPHLSAARERWCQWQGALARLAGHFRSHPEVLRRWRVSDSVPAVEPWLSPKPRSLDITRKP